MKLEYFLRKISIFQREIWSYLRTVSSRVIEKFFRCQALGWLRTLYTGLARNIKFEILGCLEALEDCK